MERGTFDSIHSVGKDDRSSTLTPFHIRQRIQSARRIPSNLEEHVGIDLVPEHWKGVGFGRGREKSPAVSIAIYATIEKKRKA